MLKFLEINNIEELFSDIPNILKLNKDLDLPDEMDEKELKRLITSILAENITIPPNKIFLGGGVYPVHVPAIVKSILGRSEFLTSYTPYQPEISQGVLQALYEYQSLISILTGLEVVNASMYDWGSSAAEALLMSIRYTRKKKIVILGPVSPNRLEVIKTYIWPHNIRLVQLDWDKDTGLTPIEDMYNQVDEDTAAIYIEVPSYIGSVETNIEEIVKIAHNKGALVIMGVDPLFLSLIKPPGDFGVDIVVGEGQVLGNPLNYGGPLLGIFAVRGDMKLIRQMPGRVIGMANTLDGKRCYTMIMQTREQHIRRENATSNICTNEALTAIASAIYISLLGADGLYSLSKSLIERSHILAEFLCKRGFQAPPYTSPYFREFIVPLEINPAIIIKRGLEAGYIVGKDITSIVKSKYGYSLHISINEFHREKELKELVELLAGGDKY
jgi:glycine dehydrogenase subunit 1